MKIIEFIKKFIQSFFIAFLVLLPVCVVYTLVFFFFIIGISYFVEEQTLKTIKETFWGTIGVSISYATAFAGVMLHKYNKLTLKKSSCD